MSFCDDCFKAVRHEGTPVGKIEKINGVETYITLPEGQYKKDTAILFLCDIWGMRFPNSQLLADDYARNGYATYIPDYLNDDPITEAMFNPATGPSQEWADRHKAEHTRPPLDAVIKGLKEHGITTFGAAGYCLGGRYAFDLAFDHVINVAVIAHPAQLKAPADLERYASTCTAPLLINGCEVDRQFPIAAQTQADELLGNGKFKPGYSRTYSPGCSHGFAVRGDPKDPRVIEGKERAFKASIEWFRKYLPEMQSKL